MNKKEISQNWCCELCGALIKGYCYNNDGKITHIKQCSSYKVEE
jgi:hypothetical protein